MHNIDFTLYANTICALVGINGSGKTTLFNSIMGIIKYQSGNIKICGLDVKSALKRNYVAYVPQSEQIDWDFPILVKDVVMQGRFGFMGMMRIPRKKDHDAVKNALVRLGIEDLALRQIGELSGGQKKRVFLARSLAQESKIILLDEPFTGVDINTENEIMKIMRQLRDEGYLLLVSTHNLGTVPDYCNQAILLNKTIIEKGNTEDVFTQANLQKTFGGKLKHILIDESTNENRDIAIVTDDERPVVYSNSKLKNTKVDRSYSEKEG